MTRLPETCDFCDLPLEEGESFTEVRLGPQKQAKSLRVDDHTGQYRNENKKHAQGRLALQLLRDTPQFEVQTYNAVEHVETLEPTAFEMEKVERGSSPSMPRGERDLRHDEVAVSIQYHPEPIESEPDARLCPRCTDIFD